MNLDRRAEREQQRIQRAQKALDEGIRRKGNGTDDGSGIATPIAVWGKDIVPEPISWVWDGWLARELIHIIAGAPGCGKTTIALGLAATVTTGGRWPDGRRYERPANVLMWSGEDHPAKTLLPRFLAAGGDPARLRLLVGVEQDGKRREFYPAGDMPLLLDTARGTPELDLVIIEPMIGAVAGDAHKNIEVRRALQPLVTLAEERHCAVLGITHFTKGTAGRDPVERVTGSVAFGAMARVVMAAARIQDEDGGEEKRVFCRAKSNIGPDSGGWDYSLVLVDVPGYIDEGLQAISIAWGQALEGQAKDLLDQPNEGGHKAPSLKEAMEWIKDFLGDKDSCLAGEALEAGKFDGHSERTLQRAAKTLGLKSVKRFDRRWEWWRPVLDPGREQD